MGMLLMRDGLGPGCTPELLLDHDGDFIELQYNSYGGGAYSSSTSGYTANSRADDLAYPNYAAAEGMLKGLEEEIRLQAAVVAPPLPPGLLLMMNDSQMEDMMASLDSPPKAASACGGEHTCARALPSAHPR